MRAGLASNTNIFGSGDQTAHALANTLTRAPGTAFDYSNASSQLFEPLPHRATGLDAPRGLLSLRYVERTKGAVEWRAGHL